MKIYVLIIKSVLVTYIPEIKERRRGRRLKKTELTNHNSHLNQKVKDSSVTNARIQSLIGVI